jgi:hypothetical protein
VGIGTQKKKKNSIDEGVKKVVALLLGAPDMRVLHAFR